MVLRLWTRRETLLPPLQREFLWICSSAYFCLCNLFISFACMPIVYSFSLFHFSYLFTIFFTTIAVLKLCVVYNNLYMTWKKKICFGHTYLVIFKICCSWLIIKSIKPADVETVWLFFCWVVIILLSQPIATCTYATIAQVCVCSHKSALDWLFYFLPLNIHYSVLHII